PMALAVRHSPEAGFTRVASDGRQTCEASAAEQSLSTTFVPAAVPAACAARHRVPSPCDRRPSVRTVQVCAPVWLQSHIQGALSLVSTHHEPLECVMVPVGSTA